MIEIKLPRQTLYLTHSEIRELLRLNPSIWEAALKRGKGIQRATKQTEREYRRAVKYDQL